MMNPLDNFINFIKDLNPNRQQKADELIRSHVLWALGAGLVPIPLLDIAAVTAVQVDLVKKLCETYEVPFDESKGKSIIMALISSTLASLGASMIKAIPFIGSVVGGATMVVLSGGATYAVGQVFVKHFEAGGNLEDFNVSAMRKLYEEELEKGKAYASKLQQEQAAKKNPDTTEEKATTATSPGDDVFAKLEKLSQLKEKGIITEEEFNRKKQELLSAI